MVIDGVTSDTVLGADTTIGPLALGDRAVIRSHVVLYRGTTIGSDAHIGHGALVREHCTIGDHVSIGSHSIVEHHVTIGDSARLHSNCFVPEHTVIEAGAWIGPGVVVTNARYPNRPDTKENLEGVRICSGAVVGAGAVLVPGITIGANALVGAGCVVTNDVSPGDVVVGNPERSIV
jgi:acetyltransferase-like isoleucine patch superfamily enzyme